MSKKLILFLSVILLVVTTVLIIVLIHNRVFSNLGKTSENSTSTNETDLMNQVNMEINKVISNDKEIDNIFREKSITLI